MSGPPPWRRPQPLRDDHDEHRSSTWLELLFDLCFVVAVAALGTQLHHDLTPNGILVFCGLFVPVWWAWMNFTWYATAFDNDDVPYRILFFLGMLGVLALASNIDEVAASDSVGFVTSYVWLKLVLVVLYVRARRHAPKVVRFCDIYAAGNAFAGAIWLLSLFVDEPGRYVLWGVALFFEILTPILAVRATDEKIYNAKHIPERYGLFTLIVLGESILAVSVGTADAGWNLASTLTAGFAFLLAAGVWWTYFDYVGASALGFGRRAAFYWGYGHLAIFASIAAIGVGSEVAIESAANPAVEFSLESLFDSGTPLDGSVRAILGGGVFVYLLAICFIYWANGSELRHGIFYARLVAACLAGLVGVLGGSSHPLPFVLALALIMLGLTVVEGLLARRKHRALPQSVRA